MNGANSFLLSIVSADRSGKIARDLKRLGISVQFLRARRKSSLIWKTFIRAIVSLEAWGEMFFGFGILCIRSMVRSKEEQLGRTDAIKSVRKGFRRSGVTDSGIPRIRMLFHLERSSRSSTFRYWQIIG